MQVPRKEELDEDMEDGEVKKQEGARAGRTLLNLLPVFLSSIETI